MRSNIPRSLICGLVVVMGIACASIVTACPICIGFPSRTEADVLCASHCVMLARQDPNDPYAYAPGTVIKGTYDGSAFDLLVDSATQRVLGAHSDCHVLLVQEVANGPWLSLGSLSKAMEALVRRIVTISPIWNGPQGEKGRIDFFVSLMGNEDPRIRELAYLELGRAPYASVRTLGRVLPRDSYEPMLTERRYMEWRGLAILLLAQSELVSDRQYILDSFRDAERFAVATNLAAWTAAALEVDPYATMDRIEEEYFRIKDHSREELQSIVRALSMHGARDEPKLRERIVVCYGRLLEAYPEFAVQIAEDLHSWKRSELSDALARILEQQSERFDVSDVSKVRGYLNSVVAAAPGTNP